MAGVQLKTEVGLINGTPNKRLFWSIISDYDLRTALCELVDNAIDHWTSAGRKRPLSVRVFLDAERQTISVLDNAGGVPSDSLHVLVAPGGSLNDPLAEIIGVFGVGSKRAGVALGEYVEIKSRKGRAQTFAIDITPEWLASPVWDLPKYEIPDIQPNTTEVHISRIRRPFKADDLTELQKRLGEIYSSFIGPSCTIELNDQKVTATTFDNWAYPPRYSPKSIELELDFGADGNVRVAMISGLIADRDPEKDNYGVYFYCNDRLIIKELKAREVGYFITSEAGVPHPDASLCRVIVKLTGPARLMPWNSNKSGINFDNPVFLKIQSHLIQLVSYFTKASRRTKADWEGIVFQYRAGKIEPVEPARVGGKLSLPPLPAANKSHIEQLKAKNSRQLGAQPWTLGLVEAIAAVDILERQKLDTRNRIALILLDSNFEIGLKEFIVHRTDLFPLPTYNDAKIQQLFSKRHLVINEIAAQIPAIKPFLAKANHYYLMRNKLIHERATVDIPSADIANYRKVIEDVLAILFKLKFP